MTTEAITPTYITVVASIVTVPVGTYYFGLLWTALAFVVYYVTLQLWSVDISWLLNYIFDLQDSKKEPEDYSGVKTEMGKIKCKIKELYVMSWLTTLDLPDKYKSIVITTVDLCLDQLSSMIANNNSVNILDVIVDLVEAVHLHVDRYNTIKADMSHDKGSLTSEFLNVAATDWKKCHTESQDEYLKLLITNMLRTLLPDENTHSVIEVISTIISENVLNELLLYLSQQRNILKIIINVFAVDSVAVLKQAELKTDIQSNDSQTPVTFYLDTKSEPVSSHEVKQQQDSQATTVPTDRCEPNDEAVVSQPSRNEMEVAEDGLIADEIASEKTSDESFEHIEYVSEELSKFMKVAPPTPISADKPDINSEKVIPATMLFPASAISSEERGKILKSSSVDSDYSADTRSCDSGMSEEAGMSGEKGVHDGSGNSGASLEVCNHHSFSINSGMSVDTPYTSTEDLKSLEKRFISVAINGVETHAERYNNSKYTLYVIEYTALYKDENSCVFVSRDNKVYRRYREFVNLLARLEKSSKHNKLLKSVKTPSWWTQISLRALKPNEIEKRRKQLDVFLKQLIEISAINTCKELEEFLAYNGGGEIEFVQEKTEIIPSAVRIDKMVFRTVSGVVDKVTKITSPNISGSPERNYQTQRKKTKPDFVVTHHQEPVYHDSKHITCDLLELSEHDLSEKLQSEQNTSQGANSSQRAGADNFSCVSDRLTVLAACLFQLVVYLLQFHNSLSRNSKLVTKIQSMLIPALKLWLKHKLEFYTSPPQLVRFMKLFQEALWPTDTIPEVNYDLTVLRKLAVEAILADIPTPVVTVVGGDIRKILANLIEVTTDSEVTRQFGFCVLEQAAKNSLKSLLSQ